MKRLTLAVGLFGVLAVSALQAQTRLEANIPFEFRMGKTTLPAGHYLFDYTSRLVVVYQQGGQKTAVMAMTLPVARPRATDTGIVEFNRYGDAYFLAKLWTPSSPEGAALPKTAREKELASRTIPVQTEAIVLQTK
jgi:hypothetical protein